MQVTNEQVDVQVTNEQVDVQVTNEQLDGRQVSNEPCNELYGQ